MISRIKGLLLDSGIKGKDYFAEVMTSGGVGYFLVITHKSYDEITSSDASDEIEVFTHLVVREDNQTLFGFANQEERRVFELLITVSGVGPKTAIAILSTYSTDDLKKLISSGEDKLLAKVPGLGNKTAQKIIIDLKAKMESIDENGATVNYSVGSPLINDLSDALKALGFKNNEYQKKLEYGNQIIKDNPEILIEELIQKVLSGN